jgi:hypothetical protein
MIRYINKVLAPYRLKTIERLSLSDQQKMIVILEDLHYSHKDPAVLALMGAMNIIPIYVPAGCTDLHQVCDRVVNKPYKSGVVSSFVDYVLSEMYLTWNQRENQTPNDVFHLCLAGSVMKPLIPGYVERGMAAIDTQLMKEVIKTSFYIDAFLKEARMSETYAAAKLQYPVPIDEIPIPEEREAEEDTGPVADEVGEAIVTTADDSTGVFDVEVGQEEEETEMHVEEDGLEDVEEIIEDVSADVQPAPQLQAKKRRTQTGKPAAKAGKRKRTEDAVAAAQGLEE